jgi:PP-loop superfamily ATP-utilizing enzyme
MSNGFQTKREMAADKFKRVDMTQDEIIEIAKKAGMTSVDKKSQYLRDCLERFAKLVAKAEREACAKVCDVLAVHPEYASEVTKLAALAIRARGEA